MVMCRIPPPPPPPRPQQNQKFYNAEADQWVEYLKDFPKAVNVWMCSYCRTKTNLFTHRANGGKPCYNCGSTSGEIK